MWMGYLQDWGRTTKDFVLAYSTEIGGSIAVLIVASLGYVAPKLGAYVFKRKGAGMSKTAYRRQRSSKRLAEHKAVADGLAAMLLDLHAAGKIDDAAYKRYHLYFGAEFGFSDLLPVGLTAADLKDAMKKRRNGGSYYGVYSPVKIPGPRPGERTAAVNKLDAIFRKHIN